MADRPGELAGR
jgi:hypothetical protein